MTKYTATFSDGATVTRKTNCTYNVAWQASWISADGEKRTSTGFSISREKVQPDSPAYWHTGAGISAKQRELNKASNAKILIDSGYSVEVVPVTSI